MLPAGRVWQNTGRLRQLRRAVPSDKGPFMTALYEAVWFRVGSLFRPKVAGTLRVPYAAERKLGALDTVGDAELALGGGRHTECACYFRHAILICLAITTLLSAGCDRGPSAATADPRSAARAFVTAMNTGDAAAIAAVTTGDEPSLQLLVSLAKLNAAHTRLEKLSADKFGNAKAVFAYPRGRDSFAAMAAEIDKAPETITGNSATIGKGLGAVNLLKVDNAWKVDRSAYVPPGDGGSAKAVTDLLAAAYTEVADGIASGSLKTADEAKAVLMGKQQQAVLSQMDDAPATRPAKAMR